MTRIFVSYKREDTKHLTHRIGEDLQRRYGIENVFVDVNNVTIGSDFRSQIRQKLDVCDIFIAVIGARWLERRSGNIHNEADWVRVEIETALERKVPIIPLLVDGTKMPTVRELPDSLDEFAYKQAFNFNSEDYNNQVARFIAQLEGLIERQRTLATKTPPPPPASTTVAPRSEAPVAAFAKSEQTSSALSPAQLTDARHGFWLLVGLSVWAVAGTWKNYPTINTYAWIAFGVLLTLYLIWELATYISRDRT
jgi:hypothetical protein